MRKQPTDHTASDRLFALAGSLEGQRGTGGEMSATEARDLSRVLHTVAGRVEEMERQDGERRPLAFPVVPPAFLQLRWLATLLHDQARRDGRVVLTAAHAEALIAQLNGWAATLRVVEKRNTAVQCHAARQRAADAEADARVPF